MVTDSVVRLEFRSHFDMLDFVQVVSDEMGRLVGFDEDSTHWVSVAARESVINAIKHGNQLDPAKTVLVDYRLNTTDLEIVIEDEGSGFEPSAVPDPTLEENLELPSGRGMMLMRTFMGLVDYNEKGNRVAMA